MNRGSIHRPTIRRLAHRFALGGVTLSAAMTAIGLVDLLGPGGRVVDAQAAGTAQVEVPSEPGVPPGQPLDGGGSATAFALALPPSAACSGDSVSGGYRAQSYIVPSTVDPATLTFNAAGPVPAGVGPDLRLPLFAAVSQAPYVNVATAAQTGVVVGFPNGGFSFAVFGGDGQSVLPEGTYNVGIACTRAAGAEFDKHWNVQIVVEHDDADAPGGFTWSVAAPSQTTTTTTTTTTVAPSSTSTTTTVASTTSTTSTVAGSTTTTSDPDASSTTTTDPSSSTSSTVFAGSGGGAPFGGSPSGSTFTSPSQLAATGTSATSLVVWSALLVVFGRMAVLLGRKPQVIPPK